MTTGYKYNRLSKDHAAVLLVDHQAGLLSLVNDFAPDEFRNNVLALADTAKYFKLPTILTTSFENGPNGPLMPELYGAKGFSVTKKDQLKPVLEQGLGSDEFVVVDVKLD